MVIPLIANQDLTLTLVHEGRNYQKFSFHLNNFIALEHMYISKMNAIK